MRSGGGTATGQVAQLVDVETVMAGGETLNCNCDVGGFCARGLVECDVAADSGLCDGQNGDRSHWLGGSLRGRWNKGGLLFKRKGEVVF